MLVAIDPRRDRIVAGKPSDPPDPPESKPSRATWSTARPAMVVMVVDDVADTRDMYERYLAFRGMRVISAVDGDDAIHLMQMDRPDVIVLDLAMPRVTGWDVLRQIKGSDRTRAIPVIVLSGQNARDRALAAGADSYVEKPCVPENLMREILRVLRDPQRRQ